nr:gustatory receptor 44.2 [Papilio machaon]
MIKIKLTNPIKNALVKNYNTDFVLDNFLKTEFRKIILPLYLLQCLTLAPKFSIRYDLITSDSCRTKVIIAASAFVIFVKYSYDFIVYANIIKVNLNSMYVFLISLQLWSFFAAFIVNCLLTVLRSEINAYLIVRLQRIHYSYRFVKMEVKHTMIVNWILLFSILLYYIFVFIIRMKTFDDSMLFTILSHLFFLSTDCNNIYIARVLTLFNNAILSWISEYQHIILNLSNTGTEDSHTAKLVQTYNELIAVWRMWQSVFGIPIAFLVVTTFTQAMCNVQTLIEEPTWNFNFITALTWNVRNILMVTAISFECENIYTSMKNIRVAYIMAREADTTSDAVASAVCGGAQFEALTAGGVLAVDAALLARLVATIATYAVVLLQIKFLS